MSAGEVERIIELVDAFGCSIRAVEHACCHGDGELVSARTRIATADRDAIRAALLAVVPGWRDISEAPRDRTTILAAAESWAGNGWLIDIAFWDDGHGWRWRPLPTPTHYMPIPSLPTPPAPGGEGG
jgi:hypothetical protein